ncbi:type A flavoprotein, putative [Entamoeba histolytica HM-1:IMSS-B]|uniref:Type A flavoprotein, putative n=6 Tax=Entamoeba histolytica TaxID=5759 RepID=C4M5R3_ENTH1|nr:type A flavoprotein, putative [Entamoeba histolytica HM-1:IMSS]EMD45912.1 nitric oxide reductase, putative [Entamoeba histolytica KU27]EMH72993.1 type A flavoprotein, putative [Entamoeba histolytica HM-1:IMSS-B]EMS11943.1 nitric oxide reductase, putative [Entamoeba histolytica HM-3:IMSS]ENY63669.1 nitric oxide reductase, putative [Entamoeba histolytica HM-1:IMSS-A]GAT96776.1 type a flavoprotein putative [Entamoeba histolytica]|eukprot:XP_651815.1 type A flavoprotein, putative [Entamoeba histolytica HM-1:IMSS]
MQNLAVKVVDNLYWVGVFDFDLRTFDVIVPTPFGTTYNSFLLTTNDGNVLFETVKEPFYQEHLERIENVIGKKGQINYIILNHTEPDHSGSLNHILEKYPNATIIATVAALNNLKFISHLSPEVKTVCSIKLKSLQVGEYHLKFLIQPFLHWPDTMMTVIEELKILLPCDFFAVHYAEPKLFDDQIEGKEHIFEKLYRHYFDAVMSPFKSSVLKGVQLVETQMGFPVEELQVICCSHGLIIRKDIKKIIEKYKEWSQPQMLKNKVIVVYGSAYGYTKIMTNKIVEGIKSTGVEVIVYNIVNTTITEILKDFKDAKGLLLGSPTIVGDATPPFYDLLGHLNPFMHNNRLIQCFGSFGWSGEGVKNLIPRIQQLKVKEVNKPLSIRFRPTKEQEIECFNWGKDFGSKVIDHNH